jgi:hypothetical protein
MTVSLRTSPKWRVMVAGAYPPGGLLGLIVQVHRSYQRKALGSMLLSGNPLCAIPLLRLIDSSVCRARFGLLSLWLGRSHCVLVVVLVVEFLLASVAGWLFPFGGGDAGGVRRERRMG